MADRLNIEDDLRLWLDRRWAATVALVQHVGAEAQNYMRTHAPWRDRTGAARAGLTAETRVAGRQIRLTLRHSVEYGRWLEEGTRPHEIRPRFKRALSWPGAKHPVKRVQHPGTKARPIVWPAARRAVDILRRQLDALWRGW